MFKSQISQKQKDSLSNFHYVFKRTLSHIGPTATARKRRLFVAGVIALSGVVFHFSSPQNSRGGVHVPSLTAQGATNQVSATKEFLDAHALAEVFSVLILLFLKPRNVNSFSKNYSNFIYTTAQDIRGSPA